MIDIGVAGINTLITYKFTNNVWHLLKSPSKLSLPETVPFKSIYPNAQWLSIGQSDTDRTLSIKNTQACFNARDKRIYNSIWRFSMAKDKHSFPTITDEDIVSRTLHLGAGKSRTQPMADSFFLTTVN